jgi:hypothetical protein
MLREELGRLFAWEDHHRRLVARVVLALGLTLAVDVIGSLLVWTFESGIKGSDIHGFGDSVFFTTVQLLTVSSQIKNPLTAAGKVIDIGLEIWALFVVAAIAGSFAEFFTSASSS